MSWEPPEFWRDSLISNVHGINHNVIKPLNENPESACNAIKLGAQEWEGCILPRGHEGMHMAVMVWESGPLPLHMTSCEIYIWED